MSVHFSYRPKRVYQAVLAALMAVTTTSSYALTLGAPSIQSEQHEPLSATIPVSGIDAASFSASVAPASVYQQMGMNKEAAVQVKFVQTSDNAGKLVLSSSEPISSPFADVVLNLTSDGQEHVKPQTLLMPVPTKAVKAPTVAAVDTQPALPVATGTPLQVENTAPPPLFLEEPLVATEVQLPKETAPVAPAEVAPPVVETPAVIVKTSPTPSDTETAPISTNANTDNQLDILTKQVTSRVVRVVQPTGEVVAVAPTVVAENTVSISEPENVVTETAEQPVPEPVAPSTPDSGATYVVQSGDSLWKIANEIAKANNLDVTMVMNELHNQNPAAFNNGNINQLKAKVALTIPAYEVVPSQKAIEEAISAKKSSVSKTGKKSQASKPTSTTAKTSKPNRTTTQPTRNQSVSKPLPKPQVTLVAPSQSGKATGTAQPGAKASGGELVTALQNTRQQTAKSAKRFNNLNQELSSATQKLQLQNQKLAELEARLKALKDK